MGRMFGTDGVRGIANADLSCELAMKIGAAGAYVLTNDVHAPSILVGCDTRKSGDMMAAALSAGICSVGGDVQLVGVIPTPAMAYLVQEYKADAAVMISASHNPMEYNGIKWFSSSGYKLSDELEDRIEAIVRGETELPKPVGDKVGRILRLDCADDDYKQFLVSSGHEKLDGLHIVLDCANGASSAFAQEVFLRLGAKVTVFYNDPDGSNINDHCGSTHPEMLCHLVKELHADAGFAFDGDADRVIAADEQGNVVNGDQILGMCAIAMKAEGTLKNDTLAVTVMSNLGLKQKMKACGVHIEETAVGDRYILESMLKNGYSLGGEQSGHIIFLDQNTTGDGMLSAIQVLSLMKKTGRRLSDLAGEIPIYPQVLVNVVVAKENKAAALHDEAMLEKAREIEALLGEDGRVLVRASGTEPLIRIMLEGRETEKIRIFAHEIADVLIRTQGGRLK